MYRDDEAALYAEALGSVAALIDSCTSELSKQHLRNAYEVLEKARPETELPVPSDVGVHRRESDFRKVQELLMALSLCPGIERSNAVLSMMFVSKAEAQVEKSTPGRIQSALSYRRRRRTDANADAEASRKTQV